MKENKKLPDNVKSNLQIKTSDFEINDHHFNQFTSNKTDINKYSISEKRIPQSAKFSRSRVQAERISSPTSQQKVVKLSRAELRYKGDVTID